MKTTTATEFVLKIEIDKDATLGDANLADILRQVADEVDNTGTTDNHHFIVRDGSAKMPIRFVRGCFGRAER